MTDNELLQLAAKAAGYTLAFDYDKNMTGPCIIDNGFPVSWDSLENTGDATRIAIKLRFAIDIGNCWISVQPPQLPGVEFCLTANTQEQMESIFRRVITNAAAEIGSQMP